MVRSRVLRGNLWLKASGGNDLSAFVGEHAGPADIIAVPMGIDKRANGFLRDLADLRQNRLGGVNAVGAIDHHKAGLAFDDVDICLGKPYSRPHPWGEFHKRLRKVSRISGKQRVGAIWHGRSRWCQEVLTICASSLVDPLSFVYPVLLM